MVHSIVQEFSKSQDPLLAIQPQKCLALSTSTSAQYRRGKRTLNYIVLIDAIELL